MAFELRMKNERETASFDSLVGGGTEVSDVKDWGKIEKQKAGDFVETE